MTGNRRSECSGLSQSACSKAHAARGVGARRRLVGASEGLDGAPDARALERRLAVPRRVGAVALLAERGDFGGQRGGDGLRVVGRAARAAPRLAEAVLRHAHVGEAAPPSSERDAHGRLGRLERRRAAQCRRRVERAGPRAPRRLERLGRAQSLRRIDEQQRVHKLLLLSPRARAVKPREDGLSRRVALRLRLGHARKAPVRLRVSQGKRHVAAEHYVDADAR
eukprot:6212233-Pleurochrysis_carterae.AAC.2